MAERQVPDGWWDEWQPNSWVHEVMTVGMMKNNAKECKEQRSRVGVQWWVEREQKWQQQKREWEENEAAGKPPMGWRIMEEWNEYIKEQQEKWERGEEVDGGENGVQVWEVDIN